ncbi:ethanolamine ammonia-lyase subunit EutB [Zavarzinia aquatilis]|uniref:Ethanolamine ammonia-lyase large subunit n=1 Tax=Zavarzinia aquatilis TaxID=2211142 RepID=A0A317E874_9PROT|nr:ethanolamine ammonia-lyase subunit EutB [Zavarzinia aquatilis]PWR21305.1 ethanolamine ammonia lyase large subunit [Zavarzinia aquatilis]
MAYSIALDGTNWRFSDLKDLLAKATPKRSGDELAGLAAESAVHRIAAQMALAEAPLADFLTATFVPYEIDEVTRLIVDGHDAAAFRPIASMTVGEFREWLLSPQATPEALAAIRPGLTPEMVAAVSKLMRLQDLVLVAAKCRVVTAFRNTIGLPGRFATRLQPNHPTDDSRGIAASLVDGLLLGAGDAVFGVNPATDGVQDYTRVVTLLDDIRARLDVPTQTCCLGHVTTAIKAINKGAPVDLVFQSIAGSEGANAGFGVSLAVLAEARDAALSLGRGTIGRNVMYFETGQGAALSANAHHGVDQQTMEARAYAVARRFEPLLVNTVVGFIGPEYLYNGKEITRAGLEDHFCGKMLGVPMGVDVCYTNHCDADQDDMDGLLLLLVNAGVNFVITVPGADDVMLNYQSLSYHDALSARDITGRGRAPEFEAWLAKVGLTDSAGRLRPDPDPLAMRPGLAAITARLEAAE